MHAPCRYYTELSKLTDDRAHEIGAEGDRLGAFSLSSKMDMVRDMIQSGFYYAESDKTFDEYRIRSTRPLADYRLLKPVPKLSEEESAKPNDEQGTQELMDCEGGHYGVVIEGACKI